MRRLGPAVVICTFMGALLAPAAGAASPPVASEWHRDNYGAGHERLVCLEGDWSWTCSYGDPDQDVTTGHFSGRNVTGSWSCPDWFASEICDPDNIVAVYQGAAIYVPAPGVDHPQGDSHPAQVHEDYVVTNIGGQDILYLYWHEAGIGTFYCPWFRTFQEALDAPFECTFHNP